MAKTFYTFDTIPLSVTEERLIARETEHYVFNHGDTNTAIRLFPKPIHSDDPRIIEARMANRSAS